MSLVLGAVAFLVGCVLLAAVVAPFESLRWWAGWSGQRHELDDVMAVARDGKAGPAGEAATAPYYVVFLSGIGSISGEELMPVEEDFLAELAARLPAGTVLSDVFPYSVAGVPLTGQRTFARLWRLLYRMRVRGGGALTALINVRNVFQVAVSADGRYGPMFNYGTSRQVVESLLRAGYDPGQPSPVFLLGSSGGGQIAVGTSTFVKSTLDAPVEVISFGGVMASDPGLLRLDRLTHIYGTEDSIQALGPKLFPSRLPAYVDSAWNRALRAGRIDLLPIGPLKHQGTGGYLDATTTLPEGDTPRQRTVETIGSVVERRVAVHGQEAPDAR